MNNRLGLRVREVCSHPDRGYCCFEIYNPKNATDSQVAFVYHYQTELLDTLFRIIERKPIPDFSLINVADQIRVSYHMPNTVKTYLFRIIQQYTNLK